MNTTAPHLAGTAPLEALVIRIHAAVNARRRAHGFAGLERDGVLAACAQSHVTSIRLRDYFVSRSIIQVLETPADRARAAGAAMRGVDESLLLTSTISVAAWVDNEVPVEVPVDGTRRAGRVVPLHGDRTLSHDCVLRCVPEDNA